MKRLIALLLALVLVLSLAACGAKEEAAVDAPKETAAADTGKQEAEAPAAKEEVTLHLYYANGSGVQEYTDEVEAKLGEILDGIEGYEHINIKLHPTESDITTHLTLAETNGDPIDIVFTFGLDINTWVKDGAFMELSGLVEKYPDVLSEIPTWLADMGVIYGGRYLIPAQQAAAYYTAWLWPSEYGQYYYDATGMTEEDVAAIIAGTDTNAKLDVLEDLVLAVREGTGLDSKYISHQVMVTPRYFCNSEDIISGDVQQFIIREGVDKAELWMLTDEYKTLATRFNEWFKEGLVHPDAVTLNANEFRRANQMNDISFVNDYGYPSQQPDDYSDSTLNSYGWESDVFYVKDNAYVCGTWAAGGPAIYTDCEYPEEAMMVIELLMTQKYGVEFYNTLIRGLEGIHWEWVDENVGPVGRIKTLEYDYVQAPAGVGTYSAYPWAMGNSFNAWLNQNSPDDYVDKMLALHEDPTTVSSVAIGKTFDLSELEDQIAQVSAVIAEYKFCWASDDFEATYAEFVAKVEAAGVNDVLDYLNSVLAE